MAAPPPSPPPPPSHPEPLSLNERYNRRFVDLSAHPKEIGPQKVKIEGRRRLCKLSAADDGVPVDKALLDSPPRGEADEESIDDILAGLTDRMESLSVRKPAARPRIIQETAAPSMFAAAELETPSFSMFGVEGLEKPAFSLFGVRHVLETPVSLFPSLDKEVGPTEGKVAVVRPRILFGAQTEQATARPRIVQDTTEGKELEKPAFSLFGARQERESPAFSLFGARQELETPVSLFLSLDKELGPTETKVAVVPPRIMQETPTSSLFGPWKEQATEFDKGKVAVARPRVVQETPAPSLLWSRTEQATEFEKGKVGVARPPIVQETPASSLFWSRTEQATEFEKGKVVVAKPRTVQETPASSLFGARTTQEQMGPPKGNVAVDVSSDDGKGSSVVVVRRKGGAEDRRVISVVNCDEDDVDGEGDKDDGCIKMAGTGKCSSRMYELSGKIGKILYEHQREGLKWLWSLHCMGTGGILGDDMGLGKTMQVY